MKNPAAKGCVSRRALPSILVGATAAACVCFWQVDVAAASGACGARLHTPVRHHVSVRVATHAGTEAGGGVQPALCCTAAARNAGTHPTCSQPRAPRSGQCRTRPPASRSVARAWARSCALGPRPAVRVCRVLRLQGWLPDGSLARLDGAAWVQGGVVAQIHRVKIANGSCRVQERGRARGHYSCRCMCMCVCVL